MQEPSTALQEAGLYRFGAFELDADTLELRKNGRLVKVRPQSLKILGLLVARPGQLITRDEIQRSIWGAETFVDFEQGVNHAIKEVRAALGDASGSPHFIETLPRRGYRFMAAVERVAPAQVGITLSLESTPIPDAASAVSPPSSPVTSRQRRVRRSLATAAVAAGLVALVAAVFYSTSGTGPGGQRPAPTTLSVLPFSAAEADGELAAGLSDAIAERLGSGQRHLAVRTSDPGEASSASPAANDSAESTLLLDGEIQSTGDIVGVVVRLRAAATGETVWSDRFQVRANELFSIENVVAERVVDALDLRLAASEQEQLRRQYTRNAAAYEDYLRGRAELVRYTPQGTVRAIEAFEAALARDPSYALARAGLAMACADMCLRFAPAGEVERWGLRAEAEARAALALDPNLAEAHLARAATARKWEFDWRVVMAAAGRALVLNPNLEQAHFFRAAAFYHLGFMEESLIEVRKGRALQGPDVIEPIRIEALVNLFSGNFAPARAHLEDVSRLSTIGDTYLALSQYYSGNAERSRTLLEALVSSSSASTSARAGAALAGVLAASGEPVPARRHLERVLASQYRDHHVAYSLGAAYAQLGDRTNADRWLRTAAETGFPCLPWFERDPLLEPLRNRPAFAELLAYVRERRAASTSDLDL